jgi:hypothetical protein
MTKELSIREKLRLVPKSAWLKINKDERYLIGEVAHEAAAALDRAEAEVARWQNAAVSAQEEVEVERRLASNALRERDELALKANAPEPQETPLLKDLAAALAAEAECAEPISPALVARAVEELERQQGALIRAQRQLLDEQPMGALATITDVMGAAHEPGDVSSAPQAWDVVSFGNQNYRLIPVTGLTTVGCTTCGSTFKSGVIPEPEVIVPLEYRERVRDVIRQGLAAYGQPRGIKHGAEADDWLRKLADQGPELKSVAAHPVDDGMRLVECPSCHGTGGGILFNGDEHDCSRCNGEGGILVPVANTCTCGDPSIPGVHRTDGPCQQ